MTDTKIVQAFIDSSKALFSTMFDCKLQNGKIADAVDMSQNRRATTAIIGMGGDLKGTLAIAMPERTAVAVVSKMLEKNVQPDDSQMTDGMAELVNMVAGGAKPYLEKVEKLSMNLSLPSVTEGKIFRADMEEDIPWLCVPFQCELGDFQIFLAARAQQLPDGSSRRLSALVVDDSSVMRKIISRALVQAGISTISESPDGRQAIEDAKKQAYDIILLDWYMPNMLGIDTLKTLRENGVSTPVIMVTTESEKGRIAEALACGASDYVIKPFKIEVLIKRVRDALAENG